jgi:hypothetical protein
VAGGVLVRKDGIRSCKAWIVGPFRWVVAEVAGEDVDETRTAEGKPSAGGYLSVSRWFYWVENMELFFFGPKQ